MALEERLRARHAEESLRLQEEQQEEVEELRASLEEQVGVSATSALFPPKH